MTVGEVAEVVTSLSAFGAMVLSWRNALKIKEVHDATNGMKAELVREVRTASLAKGLAQGRDEARLEKEQRG